MQTFENPKKKVTVSIVSHKIIFFPIFLTKSAKDQHAMIFSDK